MRPYKFTVIIKAKKKNDYAPVKYEISWNIEKDWAPATGHFGKIPRFLAEKQSLKQNAWNIRQYFMDNRVNKTGNYINDNKLDFPFLTGFKIYVK